MYLAVVCAAGIPALAFLVGSGATDIRAHATAIAWLLPLIVIGEVVPLRVPRGDGYEELTVSTTFAFALLLIAGAAATVASMALASLISDGARRRPPARCAFNIAQYTLSIWAAAAVLDHLHVTGFQVRSIHADDLVPFLVAGACFFVVNDTLPGIAHALANAKKGRYIVAFLLEDVPFQAGTATALISMAPLVVAAAHDSFVLILLLTAPLLAVYRSAMALARASHEAVHDPLTGLANRTQLYRTLGELLGDSLGVASPFALCLLDLDRFKEINDSLGHSLGDEVLCAVGQRLRLAVEPRDLVVRLGGDEFAVVLAEHDEDEVTEAVQRISAQLEAPFELSTVTLDIAASIGIAHSPAHGRDVSTLLRAADAALYRAKAARCGCLTYDPGAVWEHRARRPLLTDLHQALEADEFVPYFQPIADARTRRIVGVETLLRWNHPIHGTLNPVDFLALLDQSGAIRQVTAQLLEASVRQLAAWREHGWQMTVAINVTMRTLHDTHFVEGVERCLARHRVPARLLELEVTEQTIMADPHRVTSVLRDLHSMGVKLALDDFGTGYSSMAHLSEMPLDVLKIDQSFVRKMATSQKDTVIVRSTIELARNLRLATVAEGVEAESTWQALRALGCTMIQGYVISRPKAAAQLTAELQDLPGLAVPAPADASDSTPAPSV